MTEKLKYLNKPLKLAFKRETLLIHPCQAPLSKVFGQHWRLVQLPFRADESRKRLPASCPPQKKKKPQRKKLLQGLAAAEDVSMDAAVMTVLSELDDIFALEEEQRCFGFTPEVKRCGAPWLDDK